MLVFLMTILAGGRAPQAQGTAQVNPDDILYILPTLDGPNNNEIAQLRSRIGEGRYVKVGFSIYINVSMGDWNVNLNDHAALRANLAGTIADIDAAISTGRTGGYPIGLNLLCAIRGAYDPMQTAAENEDRRNMMWYSDNALAPGWLSHSRYARKQFRIQEAYIRELASVLADRMARYPETLVAVAGDGELELALDRANADPALTVYADYSPFTVAEFRDWIRAGGLYATGQPFAGQAYSLAARYAGDASPNADTNADGHTFNGDFGTSFTTWALKYFDWNLTDAETAGAIALAGFDPNAVSNASGFDAPRVRGTKPADYFAQTVVDYWKLWLTFRSAMLNRHNIEFAKWMTTSASTDSGTAGATLPKTRVSSYQIPGDYLFNGSPENPNGRYESSGSAWHTADVSPYASAGFTAFNINIQGLCGGCQFPYFLTLRGLAPAIAGRNLRFSLLEWHPSVPPGPGQKPTENQFLYDTDRGLIEQYRPTVLSPFIWNDTSDNYPIKDAGTETMLRQLVNDLKDGLPSDPRLTIDGATTGRTLVQPFTLTGAAYDLGKVRGSGRDTGIDIVTIRATPVGGGASVTLPAPTYGIQRSEVSSARGVQFGPSGFSQPVSGLPAGTYDFVVSGRSTSSLLTTDGGAVRITVAAAGTATGFTVDHTTLTFAGVRTGSTFTSLTAAQNLLVSQMGGTSSWTATSDQSWLQLSPASGVGTQTISVSVNPLTAPTSGTNTATITLTTVDGVATPKTVTVTFVVTSSTAPAAAPSGSFDTPTDGSTVSGSIALTGWALDNIEVARVELWRDAHSSDPAAAKSSATDARGGKVFIGNASFVEGARPDVESISPTTPRNYRAGWGYIMLTRGLVWDGQGPFKLYAFAFDAEGNMAALGSKTITINNAASIKPFGAIDTPGQGETVSGTINNFGWVIPSKGSTISQQNVQVFIDNVFVGNPGGLSQRPDLNAAFGPLGFDTSQANRVLAIDTTQFSNGVHTIGWLVTDSSGQADGVGSRFIKIQNAAQTMTQTTAATASKRKH
jgi:Big-like domain-containing protein